MLLARKAVDSWCGYRLLPYGHVFVVERPGERQGGRTVIAAQLQTHEADWEARRVRRALALPNALVHSRQLETLLGQELRNGLFARLLARSILNQVVNADVDGIGDVLLGVAASAAGSGGRGRGGRAAAAGRLRLTRLLGLGRERLATCRGSGRR